MFKPGRDAQMSNDSFTQFSQALAGCGSALSGCGCLLMLLGGLIILLLIVATVAQ